MKVLILEDEFAAAKRLEKLIAEVEAKYQIVARLQGVEDTVHWLQEYGQAEIDLAFVDIQLSDGVSFEIFDLLEITFPVIFTTAYDEYAIQAFKVNAIDYLLKPIKRAELVNAMQKFEKYSRPQTSEKMRAVIDELPDQRFKKRFIAKVGRTIKIIHIADVAYFYSESKITFVVTQEGKRYPIDPPLEALESMLDPAEFYRANRQFIVRISAIKELYTYSKSRLKLDLQPATDRDVIVSTEKSSAFKKWLAGE